MQITRRFRFTLQVLLLVTLLATPLAVFAQSGGRVVTDDEVNAIARDLYCPVCESTPLDVCPTQACADWREVIRTKLSEGETAEEIRAYFELQYGPRALAEPPRSGFTLAVWILPIGAVVVGVFLFGRYLSRIRAARDNGPAPEVAETLTVEPEPELDEYEARVERELRERYQ
jgi:cytochrome c-type biogenesis protein CcmH